MEHQPPRTITFQMLAGSPTPLTAFFFQIALAFPLLCAILKFVDNYVCNAGDCSRFFFSIHSFRPLHAQNNQNRVL